MGVAPAQDLERSSAAPEPLSENLSWLLSQAGHALKTEMTASLEKVGISPRSYHVLATAMKWEVTQIELAHAVGLDKTTMVVTLDELETAGLAKRVPSAEDRRARIVTVTKAGRQKVAKAEAIVKQVQEDVLSALPEGDRQVFLDCLSSLVNDRLAEPVVCAQPVRRRS